MKLFRLPVLLLILLELLLFTAGAAQFFDKLDRADDEIRKTDQSLIRFSYSQDEESPDNRQLMVQAGGGGVFRGAVRYRLTGAQTVSFRIYSPLGTFASPDALGVLQMGDGGGTEFLPPLASLSQVLFSARENKAYLSDGGWKVLVLDGRGRPSFAEAPDFAGEGLIRFGVNVYASSGDTLPSAALKPVRTAIDAKQYQKQIVICEDFTCPVPAGAKYLWIELNDIPEGLGGGGLRPSLAWVNIQGDGLVMGPPKESDPPPPPPESSPAGESSSSGKASSSKADAPLPESSGSRAASSRQSSPKEASSKFEGVITSPPASQKPSKPASSSSQSQRSADYHMAPPASLTQEPGRAAGEAAIYEIRRETPQADAPRASAVIYVALMAAVILYLLVKPRKKS